MITKEIRGKGWKEPHYEIMKRMTKDVIVGSPAHTALLSSNEKPRKEFCLYINKLINYNFSDSQFLLLKVNEEGSQHSGFKWGRKNNEMI